MATQIGKQEVAEKIHEANNILIITNGEPEIDHLSSCIGLFDMLQALDKKAVLVYSGAVNAALAFLKPDKIIREDAESLRDFIISFERSKVDKFRYTQDGDQYNILLTPAHRAVITEADMKYRKGDFNIDLTVALGVKSKESVDSTISQHDQLMKEIPMISITAGKGGSGLEAMSWKEESAVAVGEMIYDLCQALDEKYKMEKQTANALLMGIVDQTERYKSRRTSSTAMHVSGELLELGADPALVAENLALASAVPTDIPEAAKAETKEAETKEMVEDAVGEAGKYDTQLIKGKGKKKSGRSQRLYIRQGDKEDALSYGKKGDKLKKEEEEHKLDQLSIDAEGNLRILSDEDEEETPTQEAPATEGAPAAPAPAAASDAPASPAAPAPAQQRAKPPSAPARGGNVLMPSGNLKAPHPATGAAPPPPSPVSAAAASAGPPLPPNLNVSATALALAKGEQPDGKAPSISEIVDKSADAPAAAAPAASAAAPPLAAADKADSMNQYIDSLSSAADSAAQPAAGAPTVDSYLSQQQQAGAAQAPPLAPPPGQSPGPAAPPAAPPLPSAG